MSRHVDSLAISTLQSHTMGTITSSDIVGVHFHQSFLFTLGNVVSNMRSWPRRPAENRVLIPNSLSIGRALAVEWCTIVEGIVRAQPTIFIIDSILVGRVELEVYIPDTSSTGVVLPVHEVTKEVQAVGNCSEATVVNMLVLRRLAVSTSAVDDLVRAQFVSTLESVFAQGWFTSTHARIASNLSPVALVKAVSVLETLLS
mmetsp:Transcript_4397/g.6604  ORF Transcript_4397/g.6604 Transcript_4397/m.6604 type:complete len:201 (+) Transcript_4397:1195-1797(+)